MKDLIRKLIVFIWVFTSFQTFSEVIYVDDTLPGDDNHLTQELEKLFQEEPELEEARQEVLENQAMQTTKDLETKEWEIQKAKELGNKNPPYAKEREETLVDQNTAKDGIREISIIRDKDHFIPSRIYVSKNTPVHISIISTETNKQTAFIIEEFDIQKEVLDNKITSFDLAANKSGIFKYYCPITNVKGLLIVQ